MRDPDGVVKKINDLVLEISRCANSSRAVDLETPLSSYLRFAAEFEPEIGERILNDNAKLWRHRELLSNLYGHHLRAQEFDAARILVSAAEKGGDVKLQVAGDFAERAYARVRDMFEHCEFGRCQRFVMVGCGPLPVTMMQVLDRTGVPTVAGIDRDDQSIKTADQLFKILGSTRATVARQDGCQYDFAGAGVVYIANMCSPKGGVLHAVARSAPADVQVVVREPVSLGRLLAETVEENLNEDWRVVGWGEYDRRFLSRHLFLRRRTN